MRTPPLLVPLKRRGDGRLEDPDTFQCPACGGDLIEGWDTTGPDSFVSTGHFTCRACDYEAVEENPWKSIGPDDWVDLPRIVTEEEDDEDDEDDEEE